MAGLNNVKAKTRDSKRLQDIKQLQIAIQLYLEQNGVYPPSNAGNWSGASAGCGAAWYTNNGATYIGGLVAGNFMSVLPRDPKEDTCNLYIYMSNGTDYKLLVHQTLETFDPVTTNHPLKDPGNRQYSFAIYSPGGSGW